MQTPKKTKTKKAQAPSPPSPFKDFAPSPQPQEYLIQATLRVSLSPEQIAEFQALGPEECAKRLFLKPKGVELEVKQKVIEVKEMKEPKEVKARAIKEEAKLFQVFLRSDKFKDKSKTAELTEGGLKKAMQRWTPELSYIKGVIELENGQSSEYDAILTTQPNPKGGPIPHSTVKAVVEVKRNVKKNTVTKANDELADAFPHFPTFLFGYVAKDKKPIKASTIYDYVGDIPNIDGMFVPPKNKQAAGTVCFRTNTALAETLALLCDDWEDESAWVYLDPPPKGAAFAALAGSLMAAAGTLDQHPALLDYLKALEWKFRG